jgi:hypothetical protein
LEHFFPFGAGVSERFVGNSIAGGIVIANPRLNGNWGSLSPPWSPRARLKPWRLLNRGVYSNGIQTTSTADRYRSTYNPNPAAYHVRLPIYLPRTPCLYKYVVVDSFPRHLKGYPLALAPAA